MIILRLNWLSGCVEGEVVVREIVAFRVCNILLFNKVVRWLGVVIVVFLFVYVCMLCRGQLKLGYAS